MNSITIATKTTRMGIRLQTAVSQASKRGSNPEALAVRMGAWTRGLKGHCTHGPLPACTFWDSSEL